MSSAPSRGALGGTGRTAQLPPRPSRVVAASPVAVRRAAVLAAGAALTDLVFDPVHTHVPLCPFRALTGLDCPLCGGLRAVYELLHGRLGAALHDNAVVVAGLPVVALLWLLWAVRARAGRPAPRWPRAATLAIVVLAVAFTIVRNLPFATALRP